MLSTFTKQQSGKLCRLVTLGCKVNQYETQLVQEALQLSGYHPAERQEQADLCVVNTCTVTSEGDSKSRQMVRRLHRHNPSAQIIVMGCYAARDPDTVAQLPGVTKVVTDKSQLAEELQEFGVDEMPKGIRRFDGHHRAFVKVQDGCLLNCTYCIIPKVRPSLRSRDPADIVQEVSQLAASGFEEIVLTGVHLGHYGIDLSKGRPKSEWRRLWHLLDRLGELPGNFRIRLSSLEAAEVRDDLVRAMARNPRVVPHLHLCLQSGSDRILRRMKRRYTSGGFLERCRRLRDALDQPAFTTDVILGFPGETDADFEATCRVIRDAGFSKIHIFPYSARQGTDAANYSRKPPKAVVAERRKYLQHLEKELAQHYFQKLVGRRLDVLVENPAEQKDGYVAGTSCRYAPVVLPGYLPALQGKVVPVTAERLENGLIVGKPIAELEDDVPRKQQPLQPANGRIPLL